MSQAVDATGGYDTATDNPNNIGRVSPLMALLGQGSTGDPQRDAALQKGLLGFGLSMLANSRGKGFGEAVGSSGLRAMGSYEHAMQTAGDRKMQELQMAHMQAGLKAQEDAAAGRQRALQRQYGTEQVFRDALISPAQQALAGGGGPTVANAQRMPGLRPQFDHDRIVSGLARVDPQAAYQAAQPGAPIKLGSGDQLLDPTTYRPLAANPKDQGLPSSVEEYQFARTQGYRGTYEQWVQAKARAGASNVSVNAEKPLINELATGVGKQIEASQAGATAAQRTVTSAQRIRELVNSGQVVAGPAADWRVTALRIGQGLGVTGKTAEERLSNTSELVRNLAQGELDAAQQMKGQGQITEAERAILKRAASGDLTLTSPELMRLSQVMEKTARGRIAQHQQLVRGLGGVKGAGTLMPFFQVDMPSEAPAAGGAGAAPAVGAVMDGYRFKGGNPADPASWEPTARPGASGSW